MRQTPVLFAIACLSVATSLSSAQTASSERDAIMSVNTQLEDASAKRDSVAYAKLTTSDFIRLAGRVYSKDEWLKEGVSAGAPRKPSLNEEPIVHVYDGLAILVTKNTGQGPGRNGQPVLPQRMSRVYVKTNGNWRLAATTSSPIGAAPPPSTAPVKQLPSAAEPTGATEREIFQALRAISDANQKSDTAAFSRVTADDFIATGGAGDVLTKNDRMKAIGAATPNPGTFNVAKLKINVYGNGAVAVWENASGVVTLKALVKQGGRWVQVLNHNAPPPVGSM